MVPPCSDGPFCYAIGTSQPAFAAPCPAPRYPGAVYEDKRLLSRHYYFSVLWLHLRGDDLVLQESIKPRLNARVSEKFKGSKLYFLQGKHKQNYYQIDITGIEGTVFILFVILTKLAEEF